MQDFVSGVLIGFKKLISIARIKKVQKLENE